MRMLVPAATMERTICGEEATEGCRGLIAGAAGQLLWLDTCALSHYRGGGARVSWSRRLRGRLYRDAQSASALTNDRVAVSIVLPNGN